jgi:flagella basal body P-ring formation protein FlgA
MSMKNDTGAQNNIITRTLLTCVFLMCAFTCRTWADDKATGLQEDSTLNVYLPREVTVSDNKLSLGKVSVIRGQESLVAKAGKIELGQISVPGQKIIIDRPMLLSRLACNGIPASKVVLTGAEKITVGQKQKTITGSEFVEVAESFLEENPPSDFVCQTSPIRIPKDLILPGDIGDIELSPCLAADNSKNRAKVHILVLRNGKEIGAREVIFRLKYECHKVVTLVDIPAGAVINTENIKIEKDHSDYPEPSGWEPPYGQIAKRKLAANTLLQSYMVGPVKPEVVVERNQNVVIRIERPGFLITAIGRTMEKGRTGEYIRVRNVDSKRIVLVEVKEDGSVEPVL